nr:tyrosine-protein kinase receptor UFO-like [Pogona vitticeps]
MNDAPLEFAETNEIEVPMGDKEWVTTSELILPSVRIRDVGSYKCKTVAKGNEIFSDDTYLQLEGVYFQKHPESLSASLDKSAKLSCSFRARPIVEPAEISWMRNGAPLELAENNQSQVALDEKEWVTTSELIISSVDYTDVGHYKCVATAEGSKIFSNDAYLGLRG